MKSTLQNSMVFPGMTTLPGLCLIATFLEFSRSMTPEPGGLIEFGTFKGRVSSLLGQMMRAGDRLHLVDVADYLDHDRLAQLGVQYSFYRSSSERWDPATAVQDQFWFSHHDASHYFSNVSHELSLMAGRMSRHGVMVLDDFTDPFSQVRAAYYHQRYVAGNRFELLMQGYGKAVLVRDDVFNLYERFVLEGLQPRMAELGCATTLYRTDACAQARAFSIANKKAESDPDRYGINTWGDRFYRPQSV